MCSYENNPEQLREVHFAKEEKRLRYEYLRDRLILITNKTIDKKSSHNPYTQDYARFFV